MRIHHEAHGGRNGVCDLGSFPLGSGGRCTGKSLGYGGGRGSYAIITKGGEERLKTALNIPLGIVCRW